MRGGSGEGCLSEGQQQEGGGGVEKIANREVCVCVCVCWEGELWGEGGRGGMVRGASVKASNRKVEEVWKKQQTERCVCAGRVSCEGEKCWG